MKKITAPTLIIHHPLDHLMTGEAALYHSLLDEKGRLPSHVRDLNLSRDTTPILPERIHCWAIQDFRNGPFQPEQEILEFLFESASCKQSLVDQFNFETKELQCKVCEVVALRYFGNEPVSGDLLGSKSLMLGHQYRMFSLSLDERADAILQAKKELVIEKGVPAEQLSYFQIEDRFRVKHRDRCFVLEF